MTRASAIQKHPLLNERARKADEKGAVLIESVAVSIVLLIISFGIIDFGMLLRKSNEAADAVRSGARAGSVTGVNPNADFQILQAMKNSDQGLAGDIVKVVIFKAASPDGEPNGACAQFVAVPGECNVYEASSADSEAAVLAKSGFWAPSTRVPDVDFLGVRIQADHKRATKFFTGETIFGDSAAVLLSAAPVANDNSPQRIDGVDNGSDRVPPPGANQANQDVGGGGGGPSGGSGGNA